jgi:uncharacterized protein YecE (DUF72 family)
MSQLFIGTSGWIYSHWTGIFYPEDLPSKNKPPHQYIGGGGKLKYYSRYFKTVEINYSFYHLPRPSTYQNWYQQVPEDFLFAVKASRFITHIKRLKGVKEAWQQFIKNALYLKEKLGPILFQFPPSFGATKENIERLEQFLTLLKIYRGQTPVNLRYALEFRHKSWCDPEGKPSVSYEVNEKIYKLLKKYNVAWVIADSPSWPKAEVITADFIYIRMHGSKVLFSSKYTKEEISSVAQKIKKWLLQGKDVYCYFNNDVMGYAIENAKELIKLCE